jgi:phosphoenolpyruvate carboxykinase (GTP)
MWPGFGDNMRVLEWIIGRAAGQAGGVDTPIGIMPGPTDIALDGIGLADETRRQLFAIDADGWLEELDDVGEGLRAYGARMPQALEAERQRIREAIASGAVAGG